MDALGGEPGVYSARYAGLEASDQDNVIKLLNALQTTPTHKRTARFKCILCLIDPEGTIVYYEGACKGYIATHASGENGFGYDPIFIPDGYTQSFAELGSTVKSQLSHRAQAIQSLRKEF